MRNRCRGFACLLEAAFENRSFDDNEKEGIAQLANDIAVSAKELFEIIRTKGFVSDGAKQ